MIRSLAPVSAVPLVDTPDRGGWNQRSTVLLLCVLTLAAVVVQQGVRVGEFSYNADETQHAVTGLYVADLVRDHPWAHPIEYTYRYYAQYPALGGVLHWPPLFYCFEGLFFLGLGPTVVAARLAILFFALVALFFWFLLARRLFHHDWAAAFSTVLLALLPSILLYEKMVMLEIPLLSFCIAAVYFWIVYLVDGKKSHVYWFALFAAAALLTKQNGIYLLPFCVVSGWLCGGWKLFLRKEVLYAATLWLILIAPFYSLVYAVHWKTVAMDLNESSEVVSGDAGRWLFYLKVLPRQLGWSLLGLGVLGLLTSPQWARGKIPGIMLSWIVACYVTMTLIGHKEPRYVLYWIPPFLYFASGLLFCFFRTPILKRAGAIAALVVFGATLLSAWSLQRPYVTGYAAVPRRILEASQSAVVLFDGPLPGDFIFFMRAEDATRRFVVLRKALHAYQIKKGSGVELVHTPQETENLLREDGVRFIVVADGVPLHFESERMLRDILKTPSYKELGRFPVHGNDPAHPDSSLVLYENQNWMPPATKYLRIKMLTMGHDIVVPWDSFGGLKTK